MTMTKRRITPDDILPTPEYVKIRKERRAALVAAKRLRRLEVGPHATFHFENYESMWMQIQEMLYIEKGGAEQLQDELTAYNPLIPQGSELVATLMFEIDDEVRRRRILSQLAGVENTIAIEIAGEQVMAVPEADVERTDSHGKTSSVHFLHFPFTAAQIARFRDPATTVMLAINHPHYGHMTVMRPDVREALARDFA